MSIKSYRGEKIIAGLTARLEPPDTRYPDSFCKLILTKRRLYILEDNYNGTYNTLFVFSVQGIQNMQAQLKGLKYNRTVLGELFTNGIMTLFGGITNFSGKKKEEDIRFVITYDEGMGEYKKLYFKDLQSNSRHLIQSYLRLKQLRDRSRRIG